MCIVIRCHAFILFINDMYDKKLYELHKILTNMKFN